MQFFLAFFSIISIKIPQENLTYRADATDDDIYELERTFFITQENLAEYNASMVYIGVVYAGNCFEFGFV